MRIAFVCNEYPPGPHGGIGTFVQQLGRALSEEGHQVFIFGIGDAAEARLDGDIQVTMVAHRYVRGVSWLTKRLQFWWFTRQQIRRHRIDLVETTDFLGLLPFAVGCPVVVRLHLTATSIANQQNVRPAPSNRVFEDVQLRVHGNWLALSQHAMDLTLDSFPGVRPRRSAIIGPAITAPAELPHLEDYPADFILHAGFVSTRKGAVALAKAARTFLDQVPDLHLIYAGPVLEEAGVPLDRTIGEILGPELSKRTHFLGYVDRSTVLALMAKARAFVLASKLETFGLAVAEAMLQGCPVITSREGPFSEFVQHGETGLLVDAEDTEALTAAVLRLVEDRAFATRLAKQGQAYVMSSYSPERQLRENIRFYERCIAPRETRGFATQIAGRLARARGQSSG